MWFQEVNMRDTGDNMASWDIDQRAEQMCPYIVAVGM
jgi:hypothetical protein